MPIRRTFGPQIQGVLVMRQKFGPSLYNIIVAAASLPDLDIGTVAAVGRAVTVTIPTFDPAAVNPPVAVHALYLSSPLDPAVSPEAALAGTPAAFQGAIPVTSSGDVVINVPGVPAGTYHIATVLDFDDPPVSD